MTNLIGIPEKQDRKTVPSTQDPWVRLQISDIKTVPQTLNPQTGPQPFAENL